MELMLHSMATHINILLHSIPAPSVALSLANVVVHCDSCCLFAFLRTKGLQIGTGTENIGNW